MTTTTDAWISALFPSVTNGTQVLPPRPTLKVTGPGVPTIADDPINNQTVMTFPPNGGVAYSGTGFSHVTGGVVDAIARAVNLASADVLGILPVANGGTGLSSVGADGDVLSVSAGVPTWVTLASALPSLAGDVTGPLGTNVVSTLTGTGGVVTIEPSTRLRWNASASVGIIGTYSTGAQIILRAGLDTNVLVASTTLFEVIPSVQLDALAGSGSGYATVSNTGQLGFTATIAASAITLVGDVNGTASANHVDTLTGPGSGVVTLATGSTITQTQGGTVLAPTPHSTLAVQPVDTTYPPFQLYLEGGKFNSTWDNVVRVGWNADLTNTNKSAWYLGFEQDYEVTPGVHWHEFYLEFFDSTRTLHNRPFYAYTNQATNETGVILAFDGANGGVSVTNAAGTAYANFTTNGLQLSTTAKLTFSGGGIIQTTGGGALYTIAGSAIYGATTFAFADASLNQAIMVAPVYNGASSIQAVATVTGFTIGQATNTANAANANIIIAPQAPWNNVGNTFNTPGSLIVNLAVPTNSGTTEAAFVVQRGGVQIAAIKQYDNNATTAELVLGNGVTNTQYAIYNDSGHNNHFNSPGAALYFEIAGSQKSYMSSNIWHMSSVNSIEFDATLASVNLYQLKPATDLTTANFIISAQPPATGAVTNVNPGTLVFEIPKSLSANAFMGGVLVRQADPTTPTPLIRMGVYGGPDTTYASIWFHDAGSPTGSNYGFLGTATRTDLNALTNLNLCISSAYQLSITGTSAMVLQANANIASLNFGMVGRVSDTAPATLTIQGSYAYSLATGTNQTPGNLIFDIGAPTNGGTTEAAIIYSRNGASQASWSYAGGYWVLSSTGATGLALTVSTAQILMTSTYVQIGNANLRVPSNVQFGSVTESFGGGLGVIGIHDANTVPTTNATGGGILYSDAGALKWRSPNGVVTTVAPA